jgi:uncharacterized protein (DUF1015 family)
VPRVYPFEGLLFDPAVAGPLEQVTAPPYDVIGEDARRRYLDASRYNVVRLDLPDRTDGGSLEAARDLLVSWRADGALVPSGESLFAYEMRFLLDGEERKVIGLLCALELEAWGGRVIPHERVMPEPVEDRLALLRATRANVSAIYGTIPGPYEPLKDLLETVGDRPPLRACDDEEGVRHRLWLVPAAAPIQDLIEDEPMLIADGHHRYETALRYRDERRAVDGPGPWDRALALLVDAAIERPPVLPFHRLLIGPAPAPGFGRRVRDLDECLAALDDERVTFGSAGHEGAELVHRVGELTGSPPTVRALHEQVLDRLARDGTTVRFTPDPRAAEDAVRDGTASAAYFLPPTSAETIRAVIDRGERLPQKSTYFWPKPRTGIVIRPLS